MKKLTKEWLQEKGACPEGMRWFLKQNESDTAPVLRNLVEENHNDWANWTIVRMMNKKQKVQYAIFAAELVLKIFEEKYPDDDRPRKAIEAAKAYIKTPCKRTKDVADAAYAADDAAAAYAAAYAADDADAAHAAHAAYAAAYAADAADAAHAAYADDAAAYADDAAAYAAAYAADAAAENRRNIIEFGIKLLKLEK